MVNSARAVAPLGAMLAAAFVLWVGLISADEDFRGDPVRVAIRGPSESDLARTQLFGMVSGIWLPLERQADGTWIIEGSLLIGMIAILPEEAAPSLTNLTVTMGDRVVDVDGDRFRQLAVRQPIRSRQNAAHVVFKLEDVYPRSDSIVERYSGFLNWPGDRVAAFSLLWSRMLPAAVLVAFGWWWRVRTPRFVAFLAAPSTSRVRPRRSPWDLAGILFLVGGLAALEWREPFYFTQDDVFAAEMPWLIYGFRSVFAGEWPEYVPGIFLGGPFASVGQGQLIYLPSYIAYAIARWGLGNEFAFAEVSAVLHLAAGYGIVRMLGRKIELSPLPAVLAALSYVFSGCLLMMGRSWSPFVASAVWLPAVAYGLALLAERPVGRRWAVVIGCAIALYFQVGFPVNPAFACGFLLVGFAFLASIGAVPWSRGWAVTGAILIGAGLCVPIALEQSDMVAGIDKPGHSAGGILTILPAMFVPYPLAGGSHPLNWGTEPAGRMAEFGYFGGIFPCLLAMEAFSLWVVRPRCTAAWAERVWLVLAGVAFLLALGQYGGLWPAGTLLPVVGPLFRYPFRVYPAFVLFCCLAGARVLSILLDRRGATASLAVGIVGFALLGWHLANVTGAFCKYGAIPYPPLPVELDPIREPGSGRVLSDYPPRGIGPDYCALVPHNLGLVYGVASFDGYSPMHDNARFSRARERLKADPVAAARAYGLRWILEPGRDMVCTPYSTTYRTPIVNALQPHLVTRADVPAVRLSELPGVDPLGFVARKPEKPLPTRLTPRGADVDATGAAAGDIVVVNVIFSPKLAAYADGRPLPVVADNWDRATVVLDAPSSRLEIRYEPRWGRGLALGAVLVAVGVVVAGWGRGRAEANP